MYEFIPYQLMLGLHIGAFSINILTVIAADTLGLLWVLGKKYTLSEKLMRRFHRIIFVGLIVSVSTGAWLFWPTREYLLTVPAFYTKLVFVLVLSINAVIIGRHIKVAATHAFAAVPHSEKIKLAVSGVVSTVSWITVFVCAKQLGL